MENTPPDHRHGFSEEAFRALFKAAPDTLVIADMEGVIRTANDQVESLLGYSTDELVGRSIGLLVPERFREAHRGYVKEYSARPAIRAMASRRELYAIHRDGREVPVEISLSPIAVAGTPFVIAAVRDVTGRKAAEETKRQLDAKVQHTQKLESLGVLAGGIAHDFNNLLLVILGNVDLALRSLSPTAPAINEIHGIAAAAQNAADLCNEMLAYSGRGSFQIQSVQLSEVVEEMSHLLEVSISKKVVLNYQFAANLPAVEADVTQIRQVIMNLITNASEAIGDSSGGITVATGAMECSHQYLTGTYIDENLPDGVYVYLEVADTGCGMDAITKAKIFDPFFTTKFTGRGLGLAAILGIVRGHRGAIKVYSEPGRGTTVKALFPATDVPVEASGDELTLGDVPHADGAILLADDEETVRVVTQRMLESVGFDVLTAVDGREALEIFRDHHQGIAVVLLDMTMPHLGGADVYREMRLIDSDARVILMSGYHEQEATRRFIGKGLAGFLQKPFRMNELLVKLRGVLLQ